MNISEFHFLRPYVLLLLPLSWALLIWLMPKLRQSSRWAQIIDPALLPHLLEGQPSGRFSSLGMILALVVSTLSLVAIAGPAWEKLPQPVFDSPIHRIYVLDLSPDMAAQDLKPSRLKRAQLLAQQLLEQDSDGDVALVAFSGDAYPVVPLTSDRSTVSHLLHSLSPEIMPSMGNNIAAGLKQAEKLLEQANARRAQIVLITASSPDAAAAQVAKQLRTHGHQLEVLAAATDQAVPVPGPDGFMKTLSGQIRISKLDEAKLKALAHSGGGDYRRIDRLDHQFVLPNRSNLGLSLQQDASNELNADIWQDEGYWLLIPIMLLSLLAFRRGVMLSVLLLPFAMIAPPAEAGWWQRDDQIAHQQFKNGEHARAAETFRNLDWKAAALYEAGEYAQAAQLWGAQDTADAAFNQGNALARAGELDAALNAYQTALERNPDHQDALANKQLLEQLKQNNEQQQQQDQNPSSEQDSESERSEQKQQDANADSQNSGDNKNQQTQDDSQSQDGQTSESEGEPEQPEPGDGEPESSQQDEPGEPEQSESDNGEVTDEKAQAAATSAGETDLDAEQQQAVQQWLNRIPDDPGGLLRRKFERMDERRNEQDR